MLNQRFDHKFVPNFQKTRSRIDREACLIKRYYINVSLNLKIRSLFTPRGGGLKIERGTQWLQNTEDFQEKLPDEVSFLNRTQVT
jgi:hypothetical protein